MRVSPSSLFVVLGIVAAGTVGVLARGAAAEDTLPLPSDARSFGFVPVGQAGEVSVLEASRAFRIDLGNGPLSGGSPGAKERDAAHAIVAREVARYPRGFFKKARLRGVVFAAELVEGSQPIPSLPNVGGLLFVDVLAAETDLVRTIHHEIYHFVDLADDGRLFPDPTWEALNPPGVHYGSGGRTLRGSWAASALHAPPGFVSPYATSAVEEDKAETFALAVIRHDATLARAATDPALRAKVAELTRRLGRLDPSAPAALGL